jgi:uncharacterized integral membrane protein (TIGR00697 family)
MNKLFITLSIMMGVVVLSSNYLVQFPINYFGLNEILTYGAFSYPIAFLITDLANRSYGKLLARQIVYLGFLIGIIFTLLFSTDFADLISVRIAIGSGVAFITAQLLDIQIFDRLRKKEWFVAPLTSSLIGSTVDTFLFFSISFYATGVPWVTLSLGDLAVKVLVALIMLNPLIGDSSLISAPTIFEFLAAILIISNVSSHKSPPGSGVPVAGIILESSPSTSNVR